MGAAEDGVDLLDLNDALLELIALDERQARVVEMRCFGGLEIDDIAQLLDTSRRTVQRDWQFACAWLRVRLKRGNP